MFGANRPPGWRGHGSFLYRRKIKSLYDEIKSLRCRTAPLFTLRVRAATLELDQNRDLPGSGSPKIGRVKALLEVIGRHIDAVIVLLALGLACGCVREQKRCRRDLGAHARPIRDSLSIVTTSPTLSVARRACVGRRREWRVGDSEPAPPTLVAQHLDGGATRFMRDRPLSETRRNWLSIISHARNTRERTVPMGHDILDATSA